METAKSIHMNMIEESITIGTGEKHPISMKVPHMYCPHEITAIFLGTEMLLSYTDDIGDYISEYLPKGSPLLLSYGTSIESIDLELCVPDDASDAQLHYCMVSLLDMSAYPAHLRENILIKRIENKMFGLNFGRALAESVGWDTLTSKVVQIRQHYDNSVLTIENSSVNFQWRSDVLYCKLPIGTYSVRIKFDTDSKHIGWSNWFHFKYTRKSYRRNILIAITSD